MPILLQVHNLRVAEKTVSELQAVCDKMKAERCAKKKANKKKTDVLLLLFSAERASIGMKLTKVSHDLEMAEARLGEDKVG